MTNGERIKVLRKEQGLTQTGLAQTLNVTKGTVSTWETGSRTPNFETLEQMCELFHVSLDYLTGRSDDKTPRTMTEVEMDNLALDTVEEDLSEYALKYCRLDEYGRAAVESIILAEYNRCRAENKLLDQNGCSATIRVKRDN